MSISPSTSGARPRAPCAPWASTISVRQTVLPSSAPRGLPLATRTRGCAPPALAEVVDTNSVPELARALMDPTPLVARAASRALARIGSVDRKFEGQAARALTAALEVVDEDRVRPAILKDLQALAGKNYGDDVEEWVRYAQKLP